MPFAVNALLEAWHGVAALLSLRALPLFTFLLITPQTKWQRKLGVFAGALALGALYRSWAILPWAWFATAYLYFLAAGLVVPNVARRLQDGRISRLGAFLFCFFAFLGVPGFVWPPTMKIVALVIGWDIVLSSYSYCVDTARLREAPSRADCLFFLFVNPSLVYAQRGKRIGPPALDPRGAARILLAVVTFMTASLFIVPFLQFTRQKASSGALVGVAYVDLVLVGSVAFFLQYAQASALASLQIGLLRQAGHEIPERYNWPIRAKTLPDFWRRWNTYVGQWALSYVFWPVSLEGGRLFRSQRARIAITAVALVVAFAAVGLLHDTLSTLYAFVEQSRVTRLFVAHGVLVAIWLAVERIGQSLRARGRIGQGGTMLAVVLSRVCVWCVVAASAAIMIRA